MYTAMLYACARPQALVTGPLHPKDNVYDILTHDPVVRAGLLNDLVLCINQEPT